MPRLSDAQLELRRKGIGSSDVAAIVGLSPYRDHTRFSVWLEKRGLAEREPETLAQKWGHKVEPLICEFYQEEMGIPCKPYWDTLAHPDHEWMVATVDARAYAPSQATHPEPGLTVWEEQALGPLVECKFVGIGMHGDWATDDDGIPDYVRCQVQWQMGVLSALECHVAALIGGPSGFRIYKVPFDPELFSLLRTECEKFYRTHIVEGVEPELEASPACRAYLAAKYPKVEVFEPLTDLAADLQLLGRERATGAAQEKLGKKLKEAADIKLMAACGTTGGLIGEGWKVSWQYAKSGPDKGKKRMYRFTDTEAKESGE